MLPDPIIEIGIFKVYMYGLMISVGVAAALIVLYYYGSKKRVSPSFLDFFFYNTLAAIMLGFGSAALFQAFYDYIENPSAGFKLDGGITFIGGLIGGVIVFLSGYFIFRPKLKGRLIQMISIAPCAILVGHAFGRVGCFFAGCCHGKVTDGPFGIIFPGRTLVPVHPTQLYEALFLFILFGICTYLVMKKDFRYNLCVYLAAYGCFRFFLEFLRGDSRGEFITGISPSQFWSIIMVLSSVGVYFLLRHAFSGVSLDALTEMYAQDNVVDADDTVGKDAECDDGEIIEIFSSDNDTTEDNVDDDDNK
ncbi:MAG: prolipoprotein diacylglyceryl transferase [Clostridia bacterium]|nr:prolipoprotein diacylglyceryl transferase [Clostridia bacterium]